MRTSLLIAIGGVVAVAAAGTVWVLRQRDTPESALRAIVAAVDAKDQLAFEEHFDTKRFAQSVTEDFVGAVIADASQDPANRSGFGAIGTALGAQMLQGMKPMLTAQIEQGITAAVKGEPPPGEGRGAASVLGREVDLRKTREAFRGLDGIDQRGDVALVRLRMHLEHPDTTAVFTIRMERGPRAWKVVGVENLGRQMQALQRNRISDAYTASMKSDLRNLVTAEEAYYADSGRYARNLGSLYGTTTGVTGPTITLTVDGYTAWVGHRRSTKTCAIFVGSKGMPPAANEGEPACQEGPPR
jgi:hypothetical protein